MIEKLKQKGREIKSNALLLYRSMGDPRVPWVAKIMSMLIIAYIVSPIDLIPDFIPVLGLLDEVILVPIFLALVVKLIPADIRLEYESKETLQPDNKQIDNKPIEDKRLSMIGAVMIIIIWMLLVGFCLHYLEII